MPLCEAKGFHYTETSFQFSSAEIVAYHWGARMAKWLQWQSLICVTTDRINCDYGQSMSYQVNHSCAVVKKKVKKKNPYKTSPQDPTQASMGEMRMKTQLFPPLWAMICSPLGRGLMRIVISVQICRFSENSGKYIVFVAQWERKDIKRTSITKTKRDHHDPPSHKMAIQFIPETEVWF